MMTRRRALMQLGALPLAIGMPALVRAQGEQVYRIGALNPVTGQGSAYGTGMQKMILAMADQINAAGGVLGRKVEV
ncbi:MAG TPA: ABC transporter substrate-binding protein, partial [Bordetella sp.]